MRAFVLQRDEDVTGVSGTGVVAEGVEFADGVVVLRWCVGEHRSTVVWPNIAAVEAIHGHDGKTRVVWGTVSFDARGVSLPLAEVTHLVCAACSKPVLERVGNVFVLAKSHECEMASA